MKDVHPRFRKLAGVGGPVAPVLLHQSGLWTVVVVVVERNKIYSLRKRTETVESRVKYLCNGSVNKQGQDEGKKKKWIIDQGKKCNREIPELHTYLTFDHAAPIHQPIITYILPHKGHFSHQTRQFNKPREPRMERTTEKEHF